MNPQIEGVLLYDPFNNPHVQGCLRFFADALCATLRDLGVDHELRVSSAVPPGKWIVLGAHQGTQARFLERASDFIIFNTENGGSLVGSAAEYRRLLHSCRAWWDYSGANMARIAEGALPGCARVVRPGAHLTQFEEYNHNADRPIDVFFAGSKCDRRNHIMQALELQGLVVVSAFGLYGKKLEYAIDRSRVCLNVHYYTKPPIFEAIRVMQLHARHAYVVTENSPSGEELGYTHSDGVAAPYEKLVETAVQAARLRTTGGFTNTATYRTMHADLLHALIALG